MKIRNCMDTMTTSPVESCNKALKYGLHSIYSNMNLNTTCQRVLNRADSRIQQRQNDAKREMVLNNPYWQGQTKIYCSKKGQGFINCKHNSRNGYKSVQSNSTVWYAWCFDDEDDLSERNQWPWNELPKFIWVQKLSAITLHGRNFIHCNCSFCKWVGLPCRHMMVVMSDLVMVDICWHKAYHVHYGDDSELGTYFAIINFLILLIQHFMLFLGQLLSKVKKFVFNINIVLVHYPTIYIKV